MRNSTTFRAAFWLVAAFVISFFAVGFPYWQIPYAKVSLPTTLYDTGLVVVGVLAAAARAFGKAQLMTVILAVGVAVPAPILARIAVDTSKDPTSHNLWPFEFIIAAVIECCVLRQEPWLEACPHFSLDIMAQPNPRWSRPCREAKR